MKENLIAWHYTFNYKITSIITMGYLKKCPQKVLKGEPQGVWFSTNPIWENTVRKETIIINKKQGVRRSSEPLTRDELYEKTGFFAIRFAINCKRYQKELHNWDSYREELKKVNLTEYAEGLLATAVLWEAEPKDWLLFYGDVSLSILMNSIERWDYVNNLWRASKLYVNEETKKVEVICI